jgi:hypothetical protein
MHSDQVTRYLLGQLPESEIQRLDALRGQDENFRQRVRIVEDDLVDCFIKGQLQGEDLMRFRRYFLASAANRERVKIAQGFLDDLSGAYESIDGPHWLPTMLQGTTVGNLLVSLQATWLKTRQPLLIGLQGIGLILFVTCIYLAYDLVRLNEYRK